eukprot:762812-Hanusia_phi.AAC.6
MAKMGHNQKTLKKVCSSSSSSSFSPSRSLLQLGEMFALGGTCMWFAPSGGRDRRSTETGKVGGRG